MSGRQPKKTHEPVLLEEVIEAFKLRAHSKTYQRARIFIDATLGLGGHSAEMIKRGGFVLGIEADKETLEVARRNLTNTTQERSRRDSVYSVPKGFSEPFILVHANFNEIDKLASRFSLKNVDGILFDLGVNLVQLTSQLRGFSFQNRLAPLDMRMDARQGVSGADLLNALRKDQLIKLFEKTLDYQKARRLSEAIIKRRERKLFSKVEDLLVVVEESLTGRGLVGNSSNHPATLPMLALRMAVNSELDNLTLALPKAFELLKKGGRMVIISFHSGEDILVKNYFKIQAQEGKARLINKKPVVPSMTEVERNVSARSAKMRILERI